MSKEVQAPTVSRGAIRRCLGDWAAELLQRVGGLAADGNWRVYLVGGVVRDVLLGRPSKDLDLVVVGNARTFTRALGCSFKVVPRVYDAFGTASLDLGRGRRVDVARARSETYVRPAALPTTRPSDLDLDLRRRDFTINAIALDLAPPRFGRLIDPLGGREDLRRGLIRSLHVGSFVDDPTRALRAIRLAVRLAFSIEQMTGRSIRRAVRGGLFERLSGERLRREIERLFHEPNWRGTAGALGSYDLWRALRPGWHPARVDQARLIRLEPWAAWYASLDTAERIRPWVAALAALSSGCGEEWRLALGRRLRADRVARDELVGAPGQAKAVLESLRRTRRLLPSRVRRVCRGASVTACLLALTGTRAGAVRESLKEDLCRGRGLRADITGSDLLRAGVAQGPELGVALEAALAAKLDGIAADPEAQLRVALRALRA